MSIAFEQVLVMGSAILLGVILGGFMSVWVLPTLAVGTAGEALIPAFVVKIDITLLLQYTLLMFAVLVITLSMNIVLIRRLSLVQSLRVGEE